MRGVLNPAAGRGFLTGMVQEVRREIARGYYDYFPLPDVFLSMQRASLAGALSRARQRPALMVELKHASPGYGTTPLEPLDAERFVGFATRSGVEALSVIPQPEAFGGSLEEFAEVTRRSPLPVLFKDFVVATEQLEAARACGASAVLLLARLALSGDLDAPLPQMVASAHRLGMEAVVEVHATEEIETALSAHPDVVGVNARDLETLRLDVAGAVQVLRTIRPGPIPLLAMSGVEGPAEAARYTEAGAEALLIGTAFVRSPDKEALVRSLRGEAGTP